MVNQNQWIIGGVILAVLIGIGVMFGDQFSIIGDGQEVIEIPYSCSEPQDCIDNMIEDGAASAESVALFQEDFDLQCVSGECRGVPK
jgi:hypothetical protein